MSLSHYPTFELTLRQPAGQGPVPCQAGPGRSLSGRASLTEQSPATKSVVRVGRAGPGRLEVAVALEDDGDHEGVHRVERLQHRGHGAGVGGLAAERHAAAGSDIAPRLGASCAPLPPLPLSNRVFLMQ